MDHIHTHIAVRSFGRKSTSYTHLDVIAAVSLFSSTPRADAVFLFISDILWLSESLHSLK